MAFVSQEDKKMLTPAIKAVLKKYNMKASIAVRHHSTLVVNIKSGELDIISAYQETRLNHIERELYHHPDQYIQLEEYVRVNEYWIEDTYKNYPEICAFLTELKSAMEGPEFFNEDDSMTDYTDINVGSYDKPYVCTSETKDLSARIAEVKAIRDELKLDMKKAA
jgi:hypothetical protein